MQFNNNKKKTGVTRSTVLNLNHVRIRRTLCFEENEIFLINNIKFCNNIINFTICVIVELLQGD